MAVAETRPHILASCRGIPSIVYRDENENYFLTRYLSLSFSSLSSSLGQFICLAIVGISWLSVTFFSLSMRIARCLGGNAAYIFVGVHVSGLVVALVHLHDIGGFCLLSVITCVPVA